MAPMSRRDQSAVEPDVAEDVAAPSLRVAEAHTKDVGRSVVRMDPSDMARAGTEVGGLVLLQGKSRAVARVLPCFLEDRGKGIIQMDGVLRGNAGVGIDDRVAIRPAHARTAARVSLRPGGGPGTAPDARLVARLIEGLPLLPGNRVRATLLGSRSQDFLVEQTSPAGPVLVQSSTTIEIRREEGEQGPRRISYEDIGGLHREVQRIREMIELPLRHPLAFERLGIEPPKGVLLLGPPGTGKTLIARAVASETDAHFFSINGPEIIHKFYGESEAKLRDLFDQAEKRAPSIVFIDEIDAIAPKREKVIGDVEKRVVAQLLALMDGLSTRGNVVVIAATNIPDALDPALRRPGRFDREIAIGVPDQQGRMEILQIHTRGMPLSEDVSLAHFASVTHGFVGADLAALCREAAMAALRRILPEMDLHDISYERLIALEVNAEDFEAAFRDVEPSAIREVFTEIPDVSWEDVGGLDDIREALIEVVVWPLQHATLYTGLGVRVPKGVLLFGPPGTGKTLLVRAVARESAVNFISVKGPEFLSKWVGESEQRVREVFRKAKQAAPCILFLDEIDALAPIRSIGGGDAHVVERVISQLLAEMDGIEELKGVVVMAATNRSDMLDPALLRAGRFDVQLALGLPDRPGRAAIFRVHTRHLELEDTELLDRLANSTDGLSGADIELLCQRAAMATLRRHLRQRETADPAADLPAVLRVRAQDFDEALSELRRQLQRQAGQSASGKEAP
jgi:transitional endoplasmic reticulum ATPase